MLFPGMVNVVGNLIAQILILSHAGSLNTTFFCAVKDIWIKLIKGNSEVQSEISIVLYSQIV